MQVTQRARFEAAHRLCSSELGESENERVYGKCSRSGGHGHNYEIEVTVIGPVDPVTGLVIQRVQLTDAIQRCVLDRCDHRNLDDVIGPAVSTGENLARIFFGWLEPEFEAPLHLKQLRVYETPRNHFDAFMGGTACKT